MQHIEQPEQAANGPRSRQAHRLARRTVVGGLALLMVLVGLGASEPARAQSNPIEVENALQGTPGWVLTDPATNREIEGYASLTSVNRGGTIDLYVHTAAATYSFEVFRTGWYDGDGVYREWADGMGACWEQGFHIGR